MRVRKFCAKSGQTYHDAIERFVGDPLRARAASDNTTGRIPASRVQMDRLSPLGSRYAASLSNNLGRSWPPVEGLAGEPSPIGPRSRLESRLGRLSLLDGGPQRQGSQPATQLQGRLAGGARPARTPSPAVAAGFELE
jgi:hypothetical protein